jgi:hypothetical protein
LIPISRFKEIESIQFEEEIMKSKRITALLGFVCVLVGSISFAADLKPYKGWALGLGDPNYNVNPLDYPYLAQVIQQRGFPAWTQIQLYQGVNNVGGASIHENAQMIYWDYVSPTIELYETSTITVANGDQIFLTVEAIYYIAADMVVATDTVVGGTGKFEGAQGLIEVKTGFIKNGQSALIFDGYVATVGKAKRQ